MLYNAFVWLRQAPKTARIAGILAIVFVSLLAVTMAATPTAAAAPAEPAICSQIRGDSTLTPAQAGAALSALGCSTAAPTPTVGTSAGTSIVATATPTAPGAKSCRVNSAANLRSGPATTYAVVGSARAGQILSVIAEQANWIQTPANWIYAPLCTQVPPSVWVAPADKCEQTAKVLANGDKVDYLIGERGETIQVTIISSGPLCDPYRIIWDGVRIPQDKLPEEGKRQPFERDWTGWWNGAATWAGVSCLLEQDHDKNPDTPRLAVFDREGRTVGSTHGTQVFDLVAGGWYMAVCQGTFNPGFTVIKPTDAWTR